MKIVPEIEIYRGTSQWGWHDTQKFVCFLFADITLKVFDKKYFENCGSFHDHPQDSEMSLLPPQHTEKTSWTTMQKQIQVMHTPDPQK